jgi:transposase
MASATLTRPEGADHPDVVIGVDTHKEFHVAVALAPNGGRLGECSIPANRQGHSVLQDWTLELGSRPVFAVEGTGSFGAGLCRELLAVGYSVVEINRPDRSTRRRLGKDVDAVFREAVAIDAEAAARSFLAGTATIAPKGGTHLAEMIRLLKGNKDSASKSRTRAINQIKAILVTAPAVLREQLEPLANDDLMVTCTAFRVPLVDSPMAAAKKAQRFIARRVLRLEREIAELLDDLDQLTQQACPGLRQTYGIGTDGADALLVTVGDHPERLRSDAAFASLCGVSPLPASSGKTNRHRLNRGGNRQANATLHRIVVVRLPWHEQTEAYAARRLKEGRSKAEIMRCLKRFIAREVFHTLLGRPPVRTAAA